MSNEQPPPSLQDQEVARRLVTEARNKYGIYPTNGLIDRIASALSSARVAGEQQHCDHCSADLNGVRHILCETDYRKFAGPKWWDAGHNSEIASDDRMAYDAGRVAGEQAERGRIRERVTQQIAKARELLDGNTGPNFGYVHKLWWATKELLDTLSAKKEEDDWCYCRCHAYTNARTQTCVHCDPPKET